MGWTAPPTTCQPGRHFPLLDYSVFSFLTTCLSPPACLPSVLPVPTLCHFLYISSSTLVTLSPLSATLLPL